MAKKKKARKKTDTEIRITEYIKVYLNEYSAKSNLVKSISFKEEIFDDHPRYVAEIDYGSFRQRITYYPILIPQMNFIDAEFSFDQSEYVYNFYDIFNLFDIDDFELYCYDDLLTEKDVENALKEILNATEEYFYYFEKAQTEEYLPQLEKNYEADMSGAYGSDDWRTEEDKDWLALMNHPINTYADGQITPKMIKELRELNANGEIATVYEKRLLEYIESNKNFKRKNISEKADFDKLFKTSLLKVFGLTFLISIAAAVALTYLIHALVFSGAVILESQVKIGYSIGAGAILAMAIILSFGGRLIAGSMPKEMRERALEKYEKDMSDGRYLNKKWSRILACIAVVIVAVFMFADNLSDVGFYDNGIKFMDMPFEFCEISYEELEIYKIQGYYNSRNEYVLNENTFALCGGDKYCSVDDVAPGGELQTKLEEIAEKYNKEIKEIKTSDELHSW